MSKNSKRKKSTQTERAEKVEVPANQAVLDLPLMACGVAGIVVTGVLVWGLTQSAGLPYCGAESSCDVVQSSAWSVFLGVPLAVWGLGFYLLLTLLVFESRRRKRLARTTVYLVTVGFLLSVYLTLISGIVIKAWCAYCVSSLVILAIAFALTMRSQHRTQSSRYRLSSVATTVLVAAAMHASALGLFRAAEPADPYLVGLAQHLTANDIKFYGASWCPTCQRQKEIFGGAADQLPYVECSPHGPRGPRTTECEVKDIRSYPTWMIKGRPLARLLMPERLALISGFKSRDEWSAQ